MFAFSLCVPVERPFGSMDEQRRRSIHQERNKSNGVTCVQVGLFRESHHERLARKSCLAVGCGRLARAGARRTGAAGSGDAFLRAAVDCGLRLVLAGAYLCRGHGARLPVTGCRARAVPLHGCPAATCDADCNGERENVSKFCVAHGSDCLPRRLGAGKLAPRTPGLAGMCADVCGATCAQVLGSERVGGVLVCVERERIVG